LSFIVKKGKVKSSTVDANMNQSDSSADIYVECGVVHLRQNLYSKLLEKWPQGIFWLRG